MNIRDACDEVKRRCDLFFWAAKLGVRLFDAGRDTKKGVCPFHPDTDPSMYISRQRGVFVWYCFGCGAGGTIIDFYIMHQRVKLIDAIRNLEPSIEIDNLDNRKKTLEDLQKNLEPTASSQITQQIQKNDYDIEMDIEDMNYNIRMLALNHLRFCKKDADEFDFIHKNIFSKADQACNELDINKINEIYQSILKSLQERRIAWKKKNKSKS